MLTKEKRYQIKNKMLEVQSWPKLNLNRTSALDKMRKELLLPVKPLNMGEATAASGANSADLTNNLKLTLKLYFNYFQWDK